MQTSLFRKPFSKDLFKTKPITKSSIFEYLSKELEKKNYSIRTLKGHLPKLKNKQK